MDFEKAKKTIEQVFILIGTPTESVDYFFDEKRGHVFLVKSLEFEKVCSENSVIVKDLVYLLKRIFSKNTVNEEMFKCTIDINDQQSKIDDKIKIKALKAAEEAKSLKTDVLMDPMSSYERMIIHSTLADSIDISTESVGEGKERRVKVKYLAI